MSTIRQLTIEGVEKRLSRRLLEAVLLFVTENILSHTCVVLKTYDAIYSVVYVLESNVNY